MDFSKFGLIEFNYVEAERQIIEIDSIYDETRNNISNIIDIFEELENLIDDYSCPLSKYDLLTNGFDLNIGIIKSNLEQVKDGCVELIDETKISLEELNEFVDNYEQNYNEEEYQKALEHAIKYSEYAIGETMTVNGATFVYYNQYDYPNVIYGDSTIAASGCGPTSVAIVLSTLLDRDVTAVEVGDYLADNGYLMDGGTNREGFADVFKEHGVEYEICDGTSENIIKTLKEDNMIVYGVRGPNEFTTKSHFIVLVGLDDEGNVIVADPGSIYNTNAPWSSDYLAKYCYGQMYVVKGSDK